MEVFIPHTIRIRIPNAHHVALVGDFNNWHSSAHPLNHVGRDLWERIVDLPAGKHRYAFFVIESGAEGSLRSRVIGNGAVLWVPAAGEGAAISVSVTAHPGLALHRNESAGGREAA